MDTNPERRPLLPVDHPHSLSQSQYIPSRSIPPSSSISHHPPPIFSPSSSSSSSSSSSLSSSLSSALPVESPSPAIPHSQLRVETYNKKNKINNSTGTQFTDSSSLPAPLSPLLLALPTRWLTKISPQRRLTPTRLLIVSSLAIVYLACVFGYIFALYSIPDKTAYFIICRPLPILLLLLVVIVYAERNQKTIMYTSFVFIGLILCFVSNIIYAISQNEENVYAVSVSLLAKVSFTISFTVGVGKGAPLRFLLCVPYYAFCGAIVALVHQNLINHISIVLFIIDLFVSSTMGWRALALTSGFPGSDRAKLLLWLSVVGAALWMASDTLRIVDSFYHPVPSSVFIAPLLYYLGQMANAFSVPRRLTRSDYWLDNFTFLIDQKEEGQPSPNFKI